MDYMTALLERFRIETAQYRDAHCQTQAARESLREQLNKEQRKYLLRLTDLQNICLEEAMLCGFMTGYRLAEGIRRELEEFPPFSILAKNEKRRFQLLAQQHDD